MFISSVSIGVMITLYTDNSSARLHWICEVLFAHHWGVDFEIVESMEVFDQSTNTKLAYSDTYRGAAPCIKPAKLLFEERIMTQKIKDVDPDNYQFFKNEDQFLGFDLLAASFYLLSRYEEFLPHKKDEHGRFTYRSSMAAKQGFVLLPLVDIWSNQLRDALSAHYPDTSFKAIPFSTSLTMDVDVAYAFRGRSFMRQMRSMSLDISRFDIKRIWRRLKVFLGGKDDYETYDYWDQLISKYEVHARIFFLLGNYGKYDKNLSHHNSRMSRLIKRYKDIAGSHLSYRSHYQHEFIDKEKKRLEAIVGRNVEENRYHFLKFQLPASYLDLIEAGYEHDYSMAYAEQVGFRASTSRPYPFFDIRENKTMPLMIHPTMVMDVTLKDYMKLSPSEAIEINTTLINNIKSVGGTYRCLWHNNSLTDKDEWKGWRAVLENSIDQ